MQRTQCWETLGPSSVLPTDLKTRSDAINFSWCSQTVATGKCAHFPRLSVPPIIAQISPFSGSEQTFSFEKSEPCGPSVFSVFIIRKSLLVESPFSVEIQLCTYVRCVVAIHFKILGPEPEVCFAPLHVPQWEEKWIVLLWAKSFWCRFLLCVARVFGDSVHGLSFG